MKQGFNKAVVTLVKYLLALSIFELFNDTLIWLIVVSIRPIKMIHLFVIHFIKTITYVQFYKSKPIFILRVSNFNPRATSTRHWALVGMIACFLFAMGIIEWPIKQNKNKSSFGQSQRRYMVVSSFWVDYYVTRIEFRAEQK